MYSVLYVSKLKLCLNSELELKRNFDSKWAELDQYCDNIDKIEQVNQRLKANLDEKTHGNEKYQNCEVSNYSGCK